MPKKRANKKKSTPEVISIKGARHNNLKGFDLDIPLGKLTVVTGPSGSGKSSLAFHTLYAEGQRRYVETFSPYVRQFFDRMDKPVVQAIHGIPPAIAIEQKNNVRTTRSTVGTITEINDYLKLLYPRIAIGYDPKTGEAIEPETPQSISNWANQTIPDEQILVLFSIPVPDNTDLTDFLNFLQQQGYLRISIKGEIYRTDEPESLTLRKLPKTVMVVQDRLRVDPKQPARLLEALEHALTLGKGSCSLSWDKKHKHFSSSWEPLRQPTPALFTFNNPLGACPKCRGFGRVIGIDLKKSIPDESLSLSQGCVKPFQGERGEECQRDLLRLAKQHGIDLHTAYENLSHDEQEWILQGEREDSEEAWNAGEWYGVRGFFDWLETKAYKMHVRIFLSRYRSYTTCNTCKGKRLQPEALCFKIGQKTLPDLWTMSIANLHTWFKGIHGDKKTKTTGAPPISSHLLKTDPTLKLILTEITNRLYYLCEVGLSYLTLDRPTRTLSGGEVERVNLTTCLGASLTNTLFVLDEPTVGLHQRDVSALVKVMHDLRDKGNTLVVVEHEDRVMQAADELIDIGPGAGELGGEVIFQGPTSKATGAELNTSATLQFLYGKKHISIPKKRRRTKNKLSIKSGSHHNISKLSVDIPLGVFCCITGVSGSGKSTLVHNILFQNLAKQFGKSSDDSELGKVKNILGAEKLDDIIIVDQSPLSRTPRSTPAVFIGVFDSIRQLFVATPEATSQGLTPGWFSFNSGAGRCERCSGNGFEKVEMQFLSDLYITCPACNGSRYNEASKEFLLEGKSIADVLGCTISEAIHFLQSLELHSKKEIRLQGKAIKGLQILMEVGLGYLRLGQALNTLSGGEAQRLKLASFLIETKTSSLSTPEKTKLLIFDEPTTGLHFGDIERLLGVFQRLVDQGHSLLVIEHNMDVIKCADYIIEIGPEAGEQGGKVVAKGTPEQVSKTKTATAPFLKEALQLRSPVEQSIVAESPTIYNSETVREISISGAREHNLKNLNITIPRDELVVVTGLSGSGKSTLAFDIIFAEGQRRFLDSMSPYARQFAEQLEKPDIDKINGLPPTVAIEQRISRGGGKSTVATVTEIYHFLRLLYAKLGIQHCPVSGEAVISQSNSEIVDRLRAEIKKGNLTLLAPIIRGRKGYHTDIAAWALRKGYQKLFVDQQFKDTEGFERLERFKEHDIDIVIDTITKKTTVKSLQEKVDDALSIGKGTLRYLDKNNSIHVLSTAMVSPTTGQSFEALDPSHFSYNSPRGWCKNCRGYGSVAATYNARREAKRAERFESKVDEELDAERQLDKADKSDLIICPDCLGDRIRKNSRFVRINNTAIQDISRLPVLEAIEKLHSFKFIGREKIIARDILPEIIQRLEFLTKVGLNYLHLDRSAKTLSGGEAQRIRLAAQLGSNLRGVLYVLDEPTIGLHPRDNVDLLDTLENLKNQGNSLLVVEHDEETMRRAGHIIDLGPGAGRLGGEAVFSGDHKALQKIAKTKKLLESSKSATVHALTTTQSHPSRGARRTLPSLKSNAAWLKLTGCHANNLKNIAVALPLERLTVITGVSGCGKSSFMRGTLKPAAEFSLSKKKSGIQKTWKRLAGFQHIGAVYEVDQSPIGKTSRSCPATYVKLFDHIRKVFEQLPEARIRGYTASRFSFNNSEGQCPACKGNGRIKLEMDFLPATWVPCDTCMEMRYNPATLEIRYQGCSIGDVLRMTIADATKFFEHHQKIARPLKLLADTGLSYLQLGQASPTLSGGEAQRLKLVTELTRGVGRSENAKMKGKRNTKPSLYLIEEPTIGLHVNDVRKLIDVLHRLVDDGHTVIVIEHNTDIMAEADYIIDIGPEAGDTGGTIVAIGTPEEVAKNKHSQTAPFIRAALA